MSNRDPDSSPSRSEHYSERRSGITPRMVAEYIVNHPHFGRDRALAKGWLTVIEALEAGGDPLAELQRFVTYEFLESNNNGVPLTASGYGPA